MKSFGIKSHIETFLFTKRAWGEDVEESFPWRENRRKDRGGDHGYMMDGILWGRLYLVGKTFFAKIDNGASNSGSSGSSGMWMEEKNILV